MQVSALQFMEGSHAMKEYQLLVEVDSSGCTREAMLAHHLIMDVVGTVMYLHSMPACTVLLMFSGKAKALEIVRQTLGGCVVAKSRTNIMPISLMFMNAQAASPRRWRMRCSSGAGTKCWSALLPSNRPSRNSTGSCCCMSAALARSPWSS